jgi:hypothetical protein
MTIEHLFHAAVWEVDPAAIVNIVDLILSWCFFPLFEFQCFEAFWDWKPLLDARVKVLIIRLTRNPSSREFQ